MSTANNAVTSDDFGESAADLERVRTLIEQDAPLAQLAAFSPSSAGIGEYRFRLMSGTSVHVQARTTPAGRQRDRLGLWKYRVGIQPWRRASDIQQVVNFVREESERTSNPYRRR